MSIEQNKAVVRRYLNEIINRGNLEVADEIIASDYVNHSGGSAEYLLSVPGVRGALLATLVAEVGGNERFDRLEQAIAYAGLDASVFESGEFKGTRQHISKRGLPYLRRALYLAAFKAIQVDAELAAYFQRKWAQGKPYRLAMVAVSRKLLACWYAVTGSHRAYAPAQTTASH